MTPPPPLSKEDRDAWDDAVDRREAHRHRIAAAEHELRMDKRTYAAIDAEYQALVARLRAKYEIPPERNFSLDSDGAVRVARQSVPAPCACDDDFVPPPTERNPAHVER